ncbi:hypothetical protein IT401_00480 [Candidatus Nomurabacteria bacterium]|nr:hypothetical protein [Candidatus Nomurabacteria bacterium]
MKKIFVLLGSIIIVVLNVLPANAQSLSELPVWIGAKRFAAEQKTPYMDGTGVIVKAPKPNNQGKVTASSLEVFIALDNGQIIPVRADYILPEQGGTMETIDWGIFNQATVEQGGIVYYTQPVVVHFHRYYADNGDGTYRFTQYITL